MLFATGTSTICGASYAQYSEGFKQIRIGSGHSGNASNSSILGGTSSTINPCANNSSIGGGASNCIESSNCAVFIGGGTANKVQSVGPIGAYNKDSFIGGGYCNLVTNGKCHQTIVGGCCNESHVLGGFVGGGKKNCILSPAGEDYHAIVGGDQNKICTKHGCNFIGAGQNHLMSGSIANSTIAGGSENKIISYTSHNDYGSFIGGGSKNCIYFDSEFNVIAGGECNCNMSKHSTISGGCCNKICTNSGTVQGCFSTVGGGRFNQICERYSVIAGGYFNSIYSTGTSTNNHSTIGGGYNNRTQQRNATIAGGYTNFISNVTCASSFIGGGCGNLVSSTMGTIAGGRSNQISSTGDCGAILGGYNNTVSHDHSMVIGCNLTTTTTKTTYMNNATVACHLQVGGTTTMNSTTGRIDASNDVVAFATSDRRLKENIQPIENALCKVIGVTGNTFNWKELTKEETQTIHGNIGKDVGVIAQEIESILPEAVTTRDNGYKAVNYEKIVPLLIEAIKEQQKQIDELKSKI